MKMTIKDYNKGEYGIEPTNYGWGVFKNGKMLGEFDTEEDALEYIKINPSEKQEEPQELHEYIVFYVSKLDVSGVNYVKAHSEEEARKIVKARPYVQSVEDVQLEDSIITDSIKETLNPKIWTEEKTLKPEIKKQIEKVVEKFKKWLKEVDVEINIKDVILVGSNASYNYDNKSDLDIHILVDCSDDSLMKVYEAYKTLFNEVYDIEFKNIDVEIYVENSLDDLHSKGIYSINTGWLKEPNKEELEEKDVSEQLKPYIDEFNDIMKKKSPDVTEIDNLINKIYKLRKENFDEFGEGNLMFKEFRRLGYMEKLKNLKNIIESKELSLEDSKMDNELVEMLVANGSCATKKEAIERVKNMTEQQRNDLKKTIKGQFRRFMYEDSLDVTKEKFKELLDKGEEVYLGYNNDDADIGLVGNEAYASTEYYVVKYNNKYILYKAYTGDDGEFAEGPEEKFDNFEDLHKEIKKIKFVEEETHVKDAKGKFPHLEKVLTELNAKSKFDDEEFDSLFDFDYRIEDGNLKIYDKNEQYTINYEEDENYAREELAYEFGYKFTPYVDTIFPKIENALKQDGFGDEVLEWENNVIMTIHIPEKLVKDNCFKDSKKYNKGDKVMFNGKEYTVDTISDSNDVKEGLQKVTLVNKDGKKVEAKMFQLKDIFVKDEEDIEVIDRLIADEHEAVDAYQKAMQETEDVHEKQTFAHILSEELEHIEELEVLKQNFELPDVASITDSEEIPWILQQGENGEPEFIGWAKSYNEILKQVNPDEIYKNTYISELDDKDVYLGLKNDLDEEDVKKLDEYFKVKVKDINPRKGEKKADFISRFMKETKEEYPEQKQRLAVAYSYWNRAKDSIKDEKTVKVDPETWYDDMTNDVEKALIKKYIKKGIYNKAQYDRMMQEIFAEATKHRNDDREHYNAYYSISYYLNFDEYCEENEEDVIKDTKLK